MLLGGHESEGALSAREESDVRVYPEWPLQPKRGLHPGL